MEEDVLNHIGPIEVPCVATGEYCEKEKKSSTRRLALVDPKDDEDIVRSLATEKIKVRCKYHHL